MDAKWTGLRTWLEAQRSYYRLNRHAQEWLTMVLDRMDVVEHDLCGAVAYLNGFATRCTKPRGHWKK